MMKRTLISTCALCMASFMPVQAEREEQSWTGIYMGLGVESTKAKVSIDPDPSGLILLDALPDLSGSNTDWAGAVQLGFRKEFGMLVLGAELEGIFGSGRTIEDSVSGPWFEGAPDFLTLASEAVVSVKPKGRMVATVEVPIGSRFLIGGEAGLALARTSLSGDIYGPEDLFTGTPEHWASYSGSSDQIGFTYGIRASFRMSKALLLNAGYSFAKIGTATAPVTLDDLVIADVSTIQSAEADTKLESFRLGVGYQF